MGKAIDAFKEAELISAASAVSEAVAGGASPHDAMLKIARDRNLSRGEVELVAASYNNGKQLGQWQTGRNTLEKLATFDLMDIPKLLAELPSAGKEAAIHSDYLSPPTWLPPRFTGEQTECRAKAAFDAFSPQEPPTIPASDFKKKIAEAKTARRAADVASDEIAFSDRRLGQLLSKVADYFNFSPTHRLSKAAVVAAAETYLSKEAGELAAMAADLTPGAAEGLEQTGRLDLNRPPFSTIKAAVDCLQRSQELRVMAEKAAAAADSSERKAGFFKKTELKPQPPKGGYIGSNKKKSAGLLSAPAVGTAIGTFLGRTVGPVGAAREDLVESTADRIEDPGHENELRKIRSQAILAEMMTDPDDPISGYDPDEVVKAYNEISATTPRVSGNIHLLRPVLRRALQGSQQPFEAKELLDIEKRLSTAKPPSGGDNG